MSTWLESEGCDGAALLSAVGVLACVVCNPPSRTAERTTPLKPANSRMYTAEECRKKLKGTYLTKMNRRLDCNGQAARERI